MRIFGKQFVRSSTNLVKCNFTTIAKIKHTELILPPHFYRQTHTHKFENPLQYLLLQIYYHSPPISFLLHSHISFKPLQQALYLEKLIRNYLPLSSCTNTHYTHIRNSIIVLNTPNVSKITRYLYTFLFRTITKFHCRSKYPKLITSGFKSCSSLLFKILCSFI